MQATAREPVMDLDQEAILKSFLVESMEGLDLVEEGLVALEAGQGGEETLAAVFRAVHTLKGNAMGLGLAAAGELAHATEDLLARLRQGTLTASTGITTLLLRAVDALRRAVSASVSGHDEPLPEQLELVERLRAGAPAAPGGGALEIPSHPRTPGRRRSDIQALLERVRTLRVDTTKLDRLLDLTGEIAIARDRLTGLLESVGREEVSTAHQELDRLFLDLQELVMKVRMVPVGPVFRQFVRLTRDFAVAHGKQARLELEGEDVEVDTTVVEHLKEALTHVVRNALDHGIELPDVRRRQGKDPCGCVRLSARHEAGSIVIDVADDGAGLNRELIAARATARGLLSAGTRLTEAETDRLILEPGLSTSDAVTPVSGRGVGMDVVRRNVEALRGTVELSSTPGRGTIVALRLPLTLAILEGFVVDVSGETYVLPLDAVVECVDLEERPHERAAGRGVFSLRGESLPYVHLRRRLDVGGVPPEQQSLVVVRHRAGRAGLVVDTLLGARQTVMKPIGRFLTGIPGVAGSAILGNGRVALILDVEGLLRDPVQQGDDAESTAAMAGAS